MTGDVFTRTLGRSLTFRSLSLTLILKHTQAHIRIHTNIAHSLSLTARQRCQEVRAILKQLRSTSDDFEAKCEYAELLASQDAIVVLLACIQSIQRDAANGLRPSKNQDQDLIDLAEAAAAVLAELCGVGRQRLERAGWFIQRAGDSAGSCVFRHKITGEESCSPQLVSLSWQGELLQDLPIIITPVGHCVYVCMYLCRHKDRLMGR
jgi:hypothetical protein